MCVCKGGREDELVHIHSEREQTAMVSVTGRWLPLTPSVVVPSCLHSVPSAESLRLHRHAGGGRGREREGEGGRMGEERGEGRRREEREEKEGKEREGKERESERREWKREG